MLPGGIDPIQNQTCEVSVYLSCARVAKTFLSHVAFVHIYYTYVDCVLFRSV